MVAPDTYKGVFMSHKTFLFAALVCVLGWCCVSCEPNDPNGGSGTFVSKPFTVDAKKKVVFSPGNLQYQPSTNSWRFAAQQYDYVGELNVDVSPHYSGWIDLFSYGSGDNPTLVCNENDYYDYESNANFVDWGKNLDSDSSKRWYTLSKDEWQYLLEKRDNAKELWGIGTVNHVKGVILLPDKWEIPKDLSFYPGADEKYGWQLNVYLANDWQIMEKGGAVFLPASGECDTDFGMDYYSGGGAYWTSTALDHTCAYYMELSANRFELYMFGTRYYRYAVRLVKDF